MSFYLPLVLLQVLEPFDSTTLVNVLLAQKDGRLEKYLARSFHADNLRREVARDPLVRSTF